MNPAVYSCGYGGMIFGLISMKTLILLIIGCGLLYYFWAYVEAVLIALPMPDPKDLKDKVAKIVEKGKNAVTKKGNDKEISYTKEFNQAPESLQEDDDEEDGVDVPINSKAKNGHSSGHTDLNFNDSDEDKEGSELITLDDSNGRDRTSTAAERVPALRKPK